MPAAPSPSRACSARRNIRPAPELQLLPRATAAAHRALRKDETLNHIHWATTRRRRNPIDHGARDRPSRAARGDRRRSSAPRERINALQAAGGRGRGAASPAGRPGYRHAARRQIWPRGAVSRRPTTTSGSAGRSKRRAPGRCDSSSRRTRRAAVEWPVDHTIKVPVLLSSRRSGRAEGASRSEKLRALYDAARKVGRELADRDHRQQARPARRHDDRAVHRRALCARHQAGLVEARAAAVGRRLGKRSTRRSSVTIRCAAASCCLAWKRRRRS